MKTAQLSKWIAIGVVLYILSPSTAVAVYQLNGQYSITSEAHDGHFNPSTSTLSELGGIPPVNNIIDLPELLEPTAINQSTSFASVMMHGQVGQFKIETKASVVAQRTGNQNVGVGGSAGAQGILNVQDDFTLHSRNPGPIVINTKWTISGTLTAAATGLFDPNWSIQSIAESWVTVTGTGINCCSYAVPTYNGVPLVNTPLTGAEGVYYQLAGGNDVGQINSVFHDAPKSIPISFDVMPEQATHVGWRFDVGSTAFVQNMDLVNLGKGSANAITDFSHTFDWGGITSVVDAATGQPITDWTLESASGFDYTHAVPEPGSLLLALSFVIAGAVRRHRLCR
jgi:hypothetical protein